MTSNALFAPMFTTPAMETAAGTDAWLRAMLRFEAELATVCAAHALIPREAAIAIRQTCERHPFDALAIGRDGVASANPVVALVAALRAAVPEDARPYVHFGSTSQDVLDSAMMLVARDALAVLLDSTTRAGDAAAALARAHRDTPMLARTLLQQAGITTFGLKSAGWLSGFIRARDALVRARNDEVALQFGGAVGTLAAYGPAAGAIAGDLGAALGLPVPSLPWHTERSRVAAIAGSASIAAGAAGKVALDAVLLAQGEVAEASEGGDGGRSSAMPQKRNPANAVTALAAARHAHTLATAFPAAMLQEHERAAGAWQSEWAALSPLFGAAASAIERTATALEALVVDSGRMAANLGAARGLPFAEGVSRLLAAYIGPESAATAVTRAVASVSAREHETLHAALASGPAMAARVPPATLAAMFEPAAHLGSAERLIDAALENWQRSP